MSSFNKVFGSDKELENEGVWVTAHIEDDGTQVRFKLASIGSKKYSKELEKLARPYRHFRNGVPNDIMAKIGTEAFIKCCLLDWENVPLNNNGEKMPYNKENAAQLLEDMPSLFEFLLQASKDNTLFQRGDWEADAKN